MSKLQWQSCSLFISALICSWCSFVSKKDMQHIQYVTCIWMQTLSKCQTIHLKWRWQQTRANVMWTVLSSATEVFACLGIWQHWKSKGPQWSLLLLVCRKIAASLSHRWQFNLQSDTGSDGEKKNKKNRSSCFRNEPNLSEWRKRGGKKKKRPDSCLHQRYVQPLRHAGINGFSCGGAHATLSSWGDKTPAVTHHQQRNKIAKRWTQKRAAEEWEEPLVHGSLMNILIDSVISDDY